MLGHRCHVRAFLVVANRGAGFASPWLLLCSTSSRRVSFSSCGAQAKMLSPMWDFPLPEIQPVSPALAGGFSTAGPSGKSLYFC